MAPSRHPEKFWAAWREEDISDGEMAHIKNKAITGETLTTLFAHRPKHDLSWYQDLIAGGELAVSKQDKLLVSLLSKDRLMDMVRFFTIFDKKVGKIVARYQQVFGIKRLLSRISKVKPNGGREGGGNLAHHWLWQKLYHGVSVQSPYPP